MLEYKQIQQEVPWAKMTDSFRWFMVYDEVGRLPDWCLNHLKKHIESEIWYRNYKQNHP